MGAGDLVDSVVSIGGHAYRQDIRQAAFRFMNTQLKNDPRPVSDTEVDLVTSGPNETHPIPPEQLRVFRQDADFPTDAINGRIDYEFVPMAKSELPQAGQFTAWKDDRLLRLRQLSFHHFPERIPAAIATGTNGSGDLRLVTEAPISVRLKPVHIPAAAPDRIWLYVCASNLNEALPSWLKECSKEPEALYAIEARGLGASRWTTKNPPNYVERSHYLLGRTVDSGRVWDIAAIARYLRGFYGEKPEVYLAGEASAAVLVAYAALLEPDIAGLALCRPPASHMNNSAPPLLGVLRILDIPQAIGLLAPRPVMLIQGPPECRQTASELYRRAGADDKLLQMGGQ